MTSKTDLSQLRERLRVQMDWFTNHSGPAPFLWDDLCRDALAELDRRAVETPAEPCSACAEAHAQIGDFGIADGDIADRVGDLIERLCDCEISLGTFDPGAAAEYWLKYGTRAPEASPVKTSCDDVGGDRG